MDVRIEPVDAARLAEQVVDDDDDEIVLSWWQHPVNVVGMLVAMALVAGMIGWLVADVGNDTAAGDVDIGFLHDMRAHHEQAAQMSYLFLALPDTDAGLRTVARNIITGQNIDIGRMIQLLRDFGAPEAAETEEAMAWMGVPVPFGEMPGMATEAELDAFGATRGAVADERFVELMVAHHEGGMHMAEQAVAGAEVQEVRDFAAAILTSQADEIGELEQLVR
ncbi:MAG: DUF305 domain-containing protein [Ilumatobacteraceae bacterium]